MDRAPRTRLPELNRHLASTLLVFSFGILWILLSDRLGNLMFGSLDEYTYFQTFKGILFVALMTLAFDRMTRLFRRSLTETDRHGAAMRNSLEAALSDARTGTWSFHLPVGDINVHRGMVYANATVRAFFGVASNGPTPVLAFLGRLQPADATMLETTANRTLRGEQELFDLTLRLHSVASGERRIRLIGRRDPSVHKGMQGVWRGIAIDETESQAIRERSSQLEVAFDFTPDALGIADSDGMIRLTNRKLESLLSPNQPRQLSAVLGDRVPFESGRAWAGEVQLPGGKESRFAKLVPIRDTDNIHRMTLLSIHFATSSLPVGAGLVADGLETGTSVLLSIPEFELRVDRSLDANEQATVAVLHFEGLGDVNDLFGHEAGNLLIRSLIERVGTRFGPDATRLGGGRFAVRLLQVADEAQANQWLDRALGVLSQPLMVSGESWTPRLRAGLAYADGPATAAELISRAKAAVRHARTNAEVMAMFSPALATRQRRELEIAGRMRRDLSDNRFQCHFQPIINLQDGRVCGAETLMRWDTEDEEARSPAEFIPIAERHGLIRELGHVALASGLRRLANWQANNLVPRHFRLNLNLSPAQLTGDWDREVLYALDRYRISPESICLEITESAVMKSLEDVRSGLERLRVAGISLAMDDFGTGRSSLHLLRALPFGSLKIDQSFIREITANADMVAMVRAIIGMADALGMVTVGEGVETVEQAALLKRLGCTFGQGYLYARPLKARDFMQYCIAGPG